MKPAKIFAFMLFLTAGISSAVATEIPETAAPTKKTEKAKKTNKPKQKVPDIPLEEAIRIATTPTLAQRRAKRLEKKKKFAEKNKERLLKNGFTFYKGHKDFSEYFSPSCKHSGNQVQQLND